MSDIDNYYSGYGYDDSTQDVIDSINNASATAYNIGATWADYSGRKADRELKKYLFEKQLQWNTPKSQRERLEEAGYNPFQGHAVSTGNIDSMPDLGGSPLAGVASGLSRAAEQAVRRITSDTAIREAKLRNMQVRNEYQRLLMQHDLFPVQKDLVSNQVRALSLQSDFLDSSMLDRLADTKANASLHKIQSGLERYHYAWLKYHWRDYYDELFKSVQSRNSYYEWLKSHGDDVLDFQRSQADVANKHWDIVNNPFGFDVGTSSVSSFLNILFSFLRLFQN